MVTASKIENKEPQGAVSIPGEIVANEHFICGGDCGRMLPVTTYSLNGQPPPSQESGWVGVPWSSGSTNSSSEEYCVFSSTTSAQDFGAR